MDTYPAYHLRGEKQKDNDRLKYIKQNSYGAEIRSAWFTRRIIHKEAYHNDQKGFAAIS